MHTSSSLVPRCSQPTCEENTLLPVGWVRELWLGVAHGHLARSCHGQDLKQDWTSTPQPQLFCSMIFDTYVNYRIHYHCRRNWLPLPHSISFKTPLKMVFSKELCYTKHWAKHFQGHQDKNNVDSPLESV